MRTSLVRYVSPTPRHTSFRKERASVGAARGRSASAIPDLELIHPGVSDLNRETPFGNSTRILSVVVAHLHCAEPRAAEIASCHPLGSKHKPRKRPSRLGRRDRCFAAHPGHLGRGRDVAARCGMRARDTRRPRAPCGAMQRRGRATKPLAGTAEERSPANAPSAARPTIGGVGADARVSVELERGRHSRREPEPHSLSWRSRTAQPSRRRRPTRQAAQPVARHGAGPAPAQQDGTGPPRWPTLRRGSAPRRMCGYRQIGWVRLVWRDVMPCVG
jgi:hypothetical protein